MNANLRSITYSIGIMLRNTKCHSAGTTRVCADCKYFRPQLQRYPAEERLKYGVCTHPTSTDVDMITGDHKYMLAKDVRKNKDLCGPNGEYFFHEQRVVLLFRLVRAHMYFFVVSDFMTRLAIFLFWCAMICLVTLSTKTKL